MHKNTVVLTLTTLLFACGGADSPSGESEDHLSTYCGAAGQTCCNTAPQCQSGLECNLNNVCRKPCGSLNERCCSYGCEAGLQCVSDLCRFDGSGDGGDDGGGCVPCATKECGWDTSCGAENQQYCGSCPSGDTCYAGFCYGSTGGGLDTDCTLDCPTGMTCRKDRFGMFCDF
jgi:hypothetical protein